MQYVTSLHTLMARYDGFLIDLWGVVHDGTQAYPGVVEMFAALRDAEKSVVMLSNAPRRASVSAASLAWFGVGRECYKAMVTSGEVTHHLLHQRSPRRYYFMGPQDELDFTDGLPGTRVSQISDAEYVLNIGHYYAFQPLDELRGELADMQRLGLPMLCANPDIEVIKIDGTRYPCAGEIAQHYERIGGIVDYIGKPHAAVYDYAYSRMGTIPADRILAIGDNILTDIAGAQAHGFDSLLITGGVLNMRACDNVDRYIADVAERLEGRNVTPTFVTPLFGS